jgi:hypothetical protein
MFNVAMSAQSQVAAEEVELCDLSPLCIKGLIFIHPGFHADYTTKDSCMQELAMNPDMADVVDRYRMALPAGETLDYPAINPTGPRALPLTPLSAYPNLLICLAEMDFRNESATRFYHEVKRICGNVELFVTPRKGHVFHLHEPACVETSDLERRVVEFMEKCCMQDQHVCTQTG